MDVVNQGLLLPILRTERSISLLKLLFSLCIDNYLLVTYKVLPLLPSYSISLLRKIYMYPLLLIDVGLDILIDVPKAEKLWNTWVRIREGLLKSIFVVCEDNLNTGISYYELTEG